jgi:hypothetical protein
MLSGGPSNYQRYRAPSDDNTALVTPPIDQATAAAPCPGLALGFGELSLTELRPQAQSELLAAAKAYTASYRDLPALPSSPAPLFLTGHQAELFHPGVWFKNFMLSHVAAERGAVGIHLVIDTDVLHSASIRVPTGSLEEPRVESVPLDAWAPALPVEERRVVDSQVFASFGTRAHKTIAPLIADPLVKRWWPSVLEAAGRTDGIVGLAIAQARHQLEAAWSAATLEVPMSHCCDLPCFRQFAAALLLDHQRVRSAYNQSLAAYREAHHLRNGAQPMPDLAVDGEWHEAPFWVWTADELARKPLFARHSGTQLSLSDRQQWQVHLELPTHAPHEAVVEYLKDLAGKGVKVRTRALTTTLFARVVLSDLFFHGIGGAKYDEVTDDLAQRLWGCPPPPYLALSATLRLPIEHQGVSEADLRRVRQQLRESQWHPEHLLATNRSPAAAAALASKQQWIATSKTAENAGQRHRSIAAANATLRNEVRGERRALQHREQQLIHQVRASSMLESREYAFCLYPEEDLRQRMWRLVRDT